MAVPDFETIMLPLLRLLSLGELRTRDTIGRLSTDMSLTAEETEELLPSGRQTRFSNRVHWAIVYLQAAGLIARLSRGLYEITSLGSDVLAKSPSRIDRKFLAQFEGIQEFQRRKGKNQLATDDGVALAVGTPDDRIEMAVDELNDALRAELLERILVMRPAGFEKMIIDMMLGMGYGAGGSGNHLGRTADGGVDGTIHEDVLGLDIIYLQAKRYATGNAIGVEKIREFAGALDEKGATKGVFVTTSHFASPARLYAERSHKRLVLIDGEELTHHLVKYGVAVRPYQTIELKKLDADYFDEMNS